MALNQLKPVIAQRAPAILLDLEEIQSKMLANAMLTGMEMPVPVPVLPAHSAGVVVLLLDQVIQIPMQVAYAQPTRMEVTAHAHLAVLVMCVLEDSVVQTGRVVSFAMLATMD